MALRDVLPDRRLTFDEFQSIQRQDAFDEVYSLDKPGRIDTLILKQDGEETTIHYTDEHGWHQHDDSEAEIDDEEQDNPWDFGMWRCEACGEEMPGERAEPPLQHVHGCDEGTSNDLVFEEDTEA